MIHNLVTHKGVTYKADFETQGGACTDCEFNRDELAHLCRSSSCGWVARDDDTNVIYVRVSND